ncbi:putative membrane protein YfcA [Rubrivivax gelatinosus]|nr:TSUP family transporter [Rubrivivax gelatinosus]MBG6081921.1 putative membrane protein YfcA [Rubrivivax gelatinosus]
MHTLIDASALFAPTTLLLLSLIYLVAATFSGLSGFGFSAIGCLTLMLLPASTGVALLMALSLVTQASSYGSLRAEMRRHAGRWHRADGVLPYLVGGTAGMPFGLAILAEFGGRGLSAALGVLLVAYAAWSLLKPAALQLRRRCPSARVGLLVGAVGGVVGGFSAFPGSALVVWNGLTGIGKERGRALVQPFVLWMQIVGLSLLLATRPQVFDRSFVFLFVTALPAALLGNRLGVGIYRRTGDLGWRRYTFWALGLSGAGLVLKVALT